METTVLHTGMSSVRRYIDGSSFILAAITQQPVAVGSLIETRGDFRTSVTLDVPYGTDFKGLGY